VKGQTPLTYALLDDVALAASRGTLPRSYLRTVTVERIGPLVEFLLHTRCEVPTKLELSDIARSRIVEELLEATQSDRASTFDVAEKVTAGFITTSRKPQAEDQTPWVAFCRAMQRAAEQTGLPRQQAQGLVGAVREIEENIHLHSQRASDGVVGFRATETDFEFVVADSGIGALASFKQSPEYSELRDPGTALRLAVTDGESRLRYLEKGRGYGFHDLFVGLANLNGHLRFRSDDHAMTIDGTSPTLITTPGQMH
jgi:anti-sigma regulatory factor (Ser/Thr protein kinase)